LKAHIQAILSYPGIGPNSTYMRWGKCPLPNGVTLTSQLFELSKRSSSRSSRYFEAQLGLLQSKDEPIDETEIEVEKTIPVFGEALAFYTIAGLSLVVYHPLTECHQRFGRWSGKWSTNVFALETSAIVSLIGIWTYKDCVHILRRHPGLTLLTPDECGLDGDIDSKLLY